jgi:hypothetical protein
MSEIDPLNSDENTIKSLDTPQLIELINFYLN